MNAESASDSGKGFAPFTAEFDLDSVVKGEVTVLCGQGSAIPLGGGLGNSHLRSCASVLNPGDRITYLKDTCDQERMNCSASCRGCFGKDE